MATDSHAKCDQTLHNGAVTLLSSGDLLWRMHHDQIVYLNNKVTKYLMVDDHGHPEQPDIACWTLPPIKRPTEYIRRHKDVATRRGPYAKTGYSFSGSYAQTTFTTYENKVLGFTREQFPATRTFQATHLALVADGRRPPADGWQLFNASHLCGVSSCIRPTHLVWERLDLNFSRRMCHVLGADKVCPHQPQCILRAPYLRYAGLTRAAAAAAAAATTVSVADDDDFAEKLPTGCL